MRRPYANAYGILGSMKGGHPQEGFTIVETIIVLAVSAALFASAMSLVSGQQAKTEFNQGIREAHSQIQDIINDVSTGYYVKNKDFQCTAADTGSPSITSGAPKDQGTNHDCTFIGIVLQFAPDANPFVYSRYTVVGRNIKPSTVNTPAGSLTDALPVALACTLNPCGNQEVDGTVTTTLPYGLKVTRMEYVPDSSSPLAIKDIGSIGFISNLCNQAGNSGAQSIDLVPIPQSSRNQAKKDLAAKINNMQNDCNSNVIRLGGPAPPPPPSATTIKNPSGGVNIYIKSGDGSRCGEITIGGTGNGQLTSKLQIVDYTKCG